MKCVDGLMKNLTFKEINLDDTAENVEKLRGVLLDADIFTIKEYHLFCNNNNYLPLLYTPKL